MFLLPCRRPLGVTLPSQRCSLCGHGVSARPANVVRTKSASTASTLIRRFFTRPGIHRRTFLHWLPPTTFICFRVETSGRNVGQTLRLADRVAGHSSCQFHWCILPDIASDTKCLLYVEYTCSVLGQQLPCDRRLTFFLSLQGCYCVLLLLVVM